MIIGLDGTTSSSAWYELWSQDRRCSVWSKTGGKVAVGTREVGGGEAVESAIEPDPGYGGAKLLVGTPDRDHRASRSIGDGEHDARVSMAARSTDPPSCKIDRPFRPQARIEIARLNRSVNKSSHTGSFDNRN
ncbi:MAG: hypothetical protein EOP66_04605 [Sphingomonas sp.]|nr:MAG: hypothetical protein EOP66_04605 [Sphingomonas sp.]